VTARRQFAVVAGALATLAALAYAGGHFFRKEFFPIAVGSSAPDFHAVTLDSPGAKKSLSDYRSQVVLLNVWATWCLPCRVEMPSIEKLHQTYGPQGLKIVAVSIDDPGTEAQIRAFVKSFGLTFQVLHDPRNSISESYQVGGYPETFIIGRDGVIRKKVMEATDWNSPENRALIGRLLAERAE